MRFSQYFVNTLKEAPAEAELISHQLMLRAGYVRRLGSGLYTWTPLGLRSLRKIEAVIRFEMNQAGALEVLMPTVIPAELWQETGRWEKFGPQMLKIQDRHEKSYCFGPTHEEVITDFARREINSYRQLPVHFYQIQTKFRDEIRPRFGVMRAREFIMKDGYSFHADKDSLETTYAVMKATYHRIFTCLGLNFRVVAADTGAIGGSGSHEFHVLADAGEDLIAFCAESDYAANVELAEAIAPREQPPVPLGIKKKVETGSATSCQEVAQLLGVPLNQVLKSLWLVSEQEQHCLVLVRADHEISETKLHKFVGEFRWAEASDIRSRGGVAGSLGPVNLDGIRVLADRAVLAMGNFVCGANEAGYHWSSVNWGFDEVAPPTEVYDLRTVQAGDPSPDGAGVLQLCRGIEVGHVFQLGDRYSKAMKMTYLDEQGMHQGVEMGCYGIGVSRILGAAIEQHHDAKGIRVPRVIAPFEVVIIAVAWGKSGLVRETCLTLYNRLVQAGIDVALDDRDERLGVALADQELIGIPWRIVVGERNLKNGQVEWQGRHQSECVLCPVEGLLEQIQLSWKEG